MMCESASQWGLDLSVLAAAQDDAAVAGAPDVVVGAPHDHDLVRAWATGCDVITFDHELVDLDFFAEIEASGVVVAPSPRALKFATSKAFQRTQMADAGIPVPKFLVLASYDRDAVDAFVAAAPHGVVVKADRGGYDGRGVLTPSTNAEVHDAVRDMLVAGAVVLEERVQLLQEIAGLLVRGRRGDQVAYPLVTTVQRDGMCVEVTYPTRLDPDLLEEAQDVVRRVGDQVAAVGVLAVELFVTPDGVLLNEVATRPHNSGHWTIEGCTTSQFENHLRAVAGLPLGETAALFPNATMVNVVGSATPGSLVDALAVPGAHIHDYGKAWRPGRKLGHVTVVGTGPDVRVRAWEGAEALGTSATKESS